MSAASENQRALSQAQTTLMVFKMKRSAAARELEEANRNIAMLLVTVTELEARAIAARAIATDVDA